MEKNNIPEEVTITPVIRDIERLFNKVFSLIGFAFKQLFKGVGLFVSVSLKNIFWLFLAVAFGGGLGYLSDFYIPQTYSSHLILRPSIIAGQQLNSDIVFFNSLIKKKKTDELAKLLNISTENAKSLSEIIIEPHSSYLEKIDIINSMHKNLDSATYKYINFKELLEKDNSTFSRDFIVTVKAIDQSIFSKIETGLIAYLDRIPELQEQRKREQRILEDKKAIYLEEMASLDSLKIVLNKVMLEQAKSGKTDSKNTMISLGKTNTPSTINPLDIYTRKITYAKEVTKIDKKIVGYNHCYQVYTHFSEYGYKIGLGKLMRILVSSLLFYFLTFIVLLLIDFVKNTTKEDVKH